MSNRLSRDTEDAAKVLAAFRDKYHPRETLAEKLSAAEDLRAKLVNVTAGVRQWTVKAVGDDTQFTLNGAGSVHVRTDPETGLIHVSKDGSTWQATSLEYDSYNHDWVGSELDSEIVVPAGEARPHKAALVTVAEQLVRLLGEG
ncbi:MAG: hypothetical protein ABI488_17185 [Polyangiaceae bacterium]